MPSLDIAIDRARPALLKLGVRLDDLRGCGSQGCVYGTIKPGRVAKVTLDVNEMKVSRWIYAKGKKADPSLPHIFGVARDGDLFVIEREDLDDWEADDSETMREAFKLVEQRQLKASQWKHNLTKSDWAALQAAVKLEAWGRKNGLLLHDLEPENWGMTPDGYLALRDIGQLEVA